MYPKVTMISASIKIIACIDKHILENIFKRFDHYDTMMKC